jgi:hypothetical protein
MKIHHLRNATFVIESGQFHILIDPMLGEKGKLPPFAWLRHRPRRNPLVSLPENASDMLSSVCQPYRYQHKAIKPAVGLPHITSPAVYGQ